MSKRDSFSKKSSKSLRKLADLVNHDLIFDQEIAELQKVANQYDIAITPAMVNLIDTVNPNDPIAKQFIPSIDELKQSLQEKTDPVGDVLHTKIKGLVHRYPDRCLLKPVAVCPVYCRFCFRREQVGTDSETMSAQDFKNAFDYIANHSEIWEVILTGGDPLILKPAKLAKIIIALSKIKSVEVIRIHTRIPVVSPERISADMLTALKSAKAVYIIVHANHPKEFTQEAISACAKIIDAGMPMLSQSVLLKGVNNDVETLTALMRTFVKNRIKPYYLHHADLAKGTQHFRTTIAEGQNLMKALQGNISGLCQPTYVLDIPDGYGKIPIGPCFVCAETVDGIIVEDYCGKKHVYQDVVDES